MGVVLFGNMPSMWWMENEGGGEILESASLPFTPQTSWSFDFITSKKWPIMAVLS
jgi:hypothetical protein